MKNKYYVYHHVRSCDNVVFYIGKGNTYSKRAERKNRSKAWHAFIKLDEYYTLFEYFDNEQDSLDRERFLLNNIERGWQLVNVQKDNRIKGIPEDISEVVYYSEDSPSGLKWKVSPNYRIPKNSNVGWVNKLGYWSFEYKGKAYLVHRVIYFLFNGELGNYLINHIDTNPSNNLIVNLEKVTSAENNRKSKSQLGVLRSNNTTGVNGMSFRSTSPAFIGQVYTDKGKLHKCFSIKKLGLLEAYANCCEWLEVTRENNEW